MVDRVDCIVVGAGVVGLAVARTLAERGREVIVLEAETAIGTGISSRNSEVIHAGLYYPTGSLKARLCVAGRAQLYAYCAERAIGHRRCGKLIVATEPAQLGALKALQAQALANGVTDVQWLDAVQALALEPALRCVAALHSPSTGIVDSHALMLALQGDAERAGAMIAFASPVTGGVVRGDGIELEVGGSTPTHVLSGHVINSAGLAAPLLAARLRGLPARHVPRARYCKGSYFALAGRAPFARLIYPLHDAAGLGVHLTLDLAGQARFGPDTEWLSDLSDDGPIDWRVDPARADAFDGAIRRYWPALPEHALMPAYAGVRPKISGPDEPAHDFVLCGPADHGIAGLVNLFGIESPGLTAALALADCVAGLLFDERAHDARLAGAGAR